MDGSEGPVFRRDAAGRFAPGTGGRPFGTRNRASKRVARAILADFEAHQEALLAKLRRWHLPQYLATVSRLLPRTSEAGGPELDELGAVDTARLIADARAALDAIEAGAGTLVDLEAALLGEGPASRGTDNIGDYR